MDLNQIQQNFLALLNKANEKGAFNLEDANSAILALNALAQLINQQNAQSVNYAAASDADNDLPKDPSKP